MAVLRATVVLLAIVAVAMGKTHRHPKHERPEPLKANPNVPFKYLKPSDVDVATQLINFLVNGPGSGQTYDKLATFVDTIGNRVSGSANLVAAENYMLNALAADQLNNVHGEAVTIPKWVRGKENATLLAPRNYPMTILGLGTSIGTPKTGITAPVLVVTSFDDLQAKAAQNLTAGKIIVYNQYCDWVAEPVGCYGTSVQYRSTGASEAAKVGAVAALVRTVGSFSINSPHTGEQYYEPGVPQIPVACITIEDADMFARMQARGQAMVIYLYMEAQNFPPVTGRNIVAEWTGTDFPEEVVLVSGHLDSWDVGQGAMDDGAGAVISWQALSAMRQLNLRPRRTLRVVMWSCEEFGGIGSQQYFDAHKSNASLFSLAAESDMGAFYPQGIEFTGGPNATAVMQEIVQLLTPLNASTLYPNGGETDNSPWGSVGVPLASLDTANDEYFYFHHSRGDMMTIFTPGELDLAAAAWAVMAVMVANLDTLLPRN